MSERKAIPAKLRDKVLREAGYRCANPPCRTTLAIHLHHVIEVKAGGGEEFENLLALCPTCHSLFHADIISRESIHEWKSRLVTINKFEALGINYQKEARSDERRGFALAVAEFTWRTCEIGLLQGQRFKKRGLCTFVTEGIAVTSTHVIDDILAAAPQHGQPTIWTKAGMASFEEFRRDESLGIALVKMGAIDDAFAREQQLKRPDLTGFLSPPLQTNVRYRLVPFVGEQVGILHAPESTKEYRSHLGLQFETAVVAYSNRVGPGLDPFRYTLSPLIARIEDEGAPVFTSDARFIGIITPTLLVDGENATRHVITSLIPLNKVIPENTGDSQGN